MAQTKLTHQMATLWLLVFVGSSLAAQLDLDGEGSSIHFVHSSSGYGSLSMSCAGDEPSLKWISPTKIADLAQSVRARVVGVPAMAENAPMGVMQYSDDPGHPAYIPFDPSHKLLPSSRRHCTPPPNVMASPHLPHAQTFRHWRGACGRERRQMRRLAPSALARKSTQHQVCSFSSTVRSPRARSWQR